jgi:hypothetical protein
LVAYALYLFFQDIGLSVELSILDQMGEAKLYPSACGFFIERFLIPAIGNYFKGDLANHEYFQKHFQNKHLPPWLSGAQLNAPMNPDNAPWIRSPARGKSFLDFLNNKDYFLQVPFFCPENAARPDMFCKVQLADQTLRAAFAQFKFYKEMTPSLADGAIYTTSLEGLYTTKQAVPNSQYIERCTAVRSLLTTYLNANQGMLRIIFLSPAVPDTHEPGTIGNDVIVLLDRKYSPGLFPDDVWQFLHSLKFDSKEIEGEDLEVGRCK